MIYLYIYIDVIDVKVFCLVPPYRDVSAGIYTNEKSSSIVGQSRYCIFICVPETPDRFIVDWGSMLGHHGWRCKM